MSVVFVLGAGLVYGDAASDAGMSNAISGLRDGVLSYFNPSSGTVTEVGDSGVTIQLKNDNIARKGMRFDVFRKGSPFHHPVTGELIGYSENNIGTVEVMEESSAEGEYTAETVKGDLKDGDTVRITSSKIKLAFFQDRKADWALSEAFFRSLKDSGRFELLESYVTGYDPHVLAGKARELGAGAVLMFSTPISEQRKSLNVKLYWSDDAKLFMEMEYLVSQRTLERLKAEDEFISSSLMNLDPWASYEIQDGLLMSMGDVDNDGAKEIVVSDGQDIRIYTLKDEIQEVWMIKGKAGEQHLSIDILDLNKNGMAEIFVTALEDGDAFSGEMSDSIQPLDKKRSKLRSHIIEYGPSEGYKKTSVNMPYFFRVIGNTLLMQKFVSGRIFGGQVNEAEWKDGRYLPAKPVKLPEGANIYGFTFVDWRNSGETGLMTFDDDGYLTLYDHTGHSLWRSEKSFGKFELSFRETTHSMANPVRKWSVRGRLITINTKRGQEVLVVKRVPFASSIPGLGTTGAEVYSLWWDGSEMGSTLVLNEVSGSITDYWVDKGKLFLIAKGSIISLVKNAATGELAKGAMLYYFNFDSK
ncbi:MAG: hypothetical protein AMK71_12640 [Nitrospira bacterium SG8_35_4]|nr:MAG: hypothetical protein AMK71_12640 [Nitrospira bacterium SG8_35_4]